MAKQTYVFDKSYTEANKKKGFSSENRYRRVADLEYNELEQEIEQLEAGNKDGDPTDVSNDAPINKEDANWEKRYGDLRRHLARVESTFKSQINQLAAENNDLKSKTSEPKYPKTEQEIEAWMENYPDVYGIIKTIARRTSEEETLKLSESLEELKKDKLALAMEKAMSKLLSLHPDFDQIRQTQDFVDWMEVQPQNLQDAVFRPREFSEASAVAAARVIDLYKHDKGLDKKSTSRKVQTPEGLDAARNPTRGSGNSPTIAADDGTPRFTESQIEAMSPREFEKYEEQIYEAQRKGPPYFIYDLSGGAR